MAGKGGRRMGDEFVGRRSSRIAGTIVWLALPMLSGACADRPHGTVGPQVRDSAGVSLLNLPSEPVWDEGGTWRLREELVVAGEGEGIPAFGYLVDLDVDRRGRIFVLDQQARTVYRFDPDGTLAGILGGPGNGPGELGPWPPPSSYAATRFWWEIGPRTGSPDTGRMGASSPPSRFPAGVEPAPGGRGRTARPTSAVFACTPTETGVGPVTTCC